ncbi:MAG TPA: UDP-3-O-(3-hydroxymyristoyl)glucosamine N-acyltransferase [Polyangiaceae bacterium]|nr:UDP-3-O-(3-hydroxymyristoyl)glucosamine N-acyltransferase [Polyangiaceae bacterium]
MIPLRAAASLAELRERHGGELRGGDAGRVTHLCRVEDAGAGTLAPVLAPRFVDAAVRAHARGASLLADAAIALDPRLAPVAAWVHPAASWALAELLDECDAPPVAATWGEGTALGPNVVLGPRVTIGARVRIDANTVIGRPGFGWAFRGGDVRAIPQLGGVAIEDDVTIGPLCTIDAGTLAPTRIRRGAKLDAQVHVGHNADIGEGCIVAAQTGFAGSVVLGRGVLVGGQVGIADHVRVGAGARIAAKSGVIGDVPEGAVVAGYPAVPRGRWLRALARLYRDLPRRKSP